MRRNRDGAVAHLLGLLALSASVVAVAPDGLAQRRGGQTSANSQRDAGTAANTVPTQSAVTQPVTPSTGQPASTPTASATPPATSAEVSLLNNVINRPGLHATRPSFEFLVGVAPGAWAWPWGGIAFSPGFRLGFPLTRNGMLGNINNDMRLMVGAQWIISFNPAEYWWITAPVSLQWNFYLSEQWSVSLEAGLSVDVFVYDFLNCYDHPRRYCDRVYFHPVGGIGLRRHLSRGNVPGFPSIEFRFSYPYGIQVGLNL